MGRSFDLTVPAEDGDGIVVFRSDVAFDSRSNAEMLDQYVMRRDDEPGIFQAHAVARCSLTGDREKRFVDRQAFLQFDRAANAKHHDPRA